VNDVRVVLVLILLALFGCAAPPSDDSKGPAISKDSLAGRYAAKWTNAEGSSSWGELTIQSVAASGELRGLYLLRQGLNPTEDVCIGEQQVEGEIRDLRVTLRPIPGSRCTRTFNLEIKAHRLVGTSTRPSRRGGESQVVLWKMP
jgi:hypothetical protein